MATLQKLPYGSSCSSASSYGVHSDKVDMFPAGLRVLVVDDDFACLRIVEQMLRRCSYSGEALFVVFWFFKFICNVYLINCDILVVIVSFCLLNGNCLVVG